MITNFEGEVEGDNNSFTKQDFDYHPSHVSLKLLKTFADHFENNYICRSDQVTETKIELGLYE